MISVIALRLLTRQFLDGRKGCIMLNLKKILSGVVAGALAVSLCVPAFAEATPGEAANDLASGIESALAGGNLSALTSDMQSMTTALQDQNTTVTAAMNNAALKYFEALEDSGNPGEAYSQAGSFADDNGASWKVLYEEGSAFTADAASFMTYTDNGNTITVGTVIYGTPSSVGYMVTIMLPRGNTANQYMIKTVDNAQLNDSVLQVRGYLDPETDTTVRYVSFWAPNFSCTYQLTALALSGENRPGVDAVAQQTAKDVVEAAQQSWTEASPAQKAATDAMTTIVNKLQDSSSVVTNEMASAGKVYYDKLKDENLTNVYSEETFKPDAISVTVASENTGAAGQVGLQLNKVTAENGVVTLDMDVVANQQPSQTGYLVSIELPEKAAATSYKVTMLGEDAQKTEIIATVENGIISFWVPHFTVYQLTPLSVEQPSQGNTVRDEHPEIAEAIANGTWGQDDNAASSSSTAAVTENPIKKTGTEMSVVLFAVVVMAAVAVGGVSVAVSKSRKGE